MRRTVAELLPLRLRRELQFGRVRVWELLGSDRFSWPAFYEMDRRLVEEVPPNGTFLEVGANDGYSQSNTYALERFHGYRGILVEPLPRLAKQCRRNRPLAETFQCVLSSPEKAGQLVEMVDSDLKSVSLGLQDKTEESKRLSTSSVRANVDVIARTLSSVIDESQFSNVSLMSIDVEGAEVELLKGLDLSRHVPEFLLIETQAIDSVLEVVGNHMELMKQMSHHDYFLRRTQT